MGLEGESSAFFWSVFVIALNETCAKHEDVTGLDVAAFGFGSDVDPLGGAAALEFFKGDGVGIVGVVFNVVSVSVGTVVKKDSSCGDAVLGPVVDATFFVGGRAGDIVGFGLDGMLARERLWLQVQAELTPL